MQTLQAFWYKNKVVIIGLITAMLMAVYEITSKGDHASPWVLGWSAFIAGMSFLQKNLRGQWASISTILASSAVAFFNLHNSPVDLTLKQIANELVLPVAIQVLGLFSGPAKSREYEHSPTIVEAKVEAEQIKQAEKEEPKIDDRPPIFKG